MKLLIKGLLPCVVLFVFANCTAQIPNAKTETVKIYGNCGMCEKTIEKAAGKKGEAKADWDQDTKMAQITFDSTKTNAEQILQRIAAAGYDSDKFQATGETYGKLPECCQYERPTTAAAAVNPAVTPAVPTPALHPVGAIKKQVKVVAATNPVSPVYTLYFSLKDALVATDGNTAAKQAKVLVNAIDQVDISALMGNQHTVWMKYASKLRSDATHIQGLTDPKTQREYFATLSENLYAVMKVIPSETPVYYDRCPMYNEGKGGNWLSVESAINNPYFGQQMLHCGSVVETLK